MSEVPENEPRRRRILPALAILAAGVVGVVALVATRPAPERVTLERTPPRVSVLSLEARSGVISVRGTGTIRPRAEITLSPQVAGRVVEVSPSLSSGGAFRTGDMLMKIEADGFRNAVAVARADVAQRQVDVALARQEQIVAGEEFRMLQAREGRDAPRADTALAVRLALRQPQFEAAQAALARAEALLADAELDLERTVVRAPFHGRVRSESVDVGQYVAPGQGVAQLYDIDEAEMVVSLTPAEAALVEGLWEKRAGDDAVTIPASVRSEFGGVWYQWDGYVDRAQSALDATTRTVDVVVRIPEPFEPREGPPLLIGSYAHASIEARAEPAYYAVPRPALRGDRNIWIMTPDMTVRTLPVRVIQEVQDTVFVAAEVPEGAAVVVSDLAVMTEGMAVSTGGGSVR